MKVIIKQTERDRLEALTHGGKTKISRRSFLSGIYGSTLTYVLAPTVLNLVAQRVMAADCGATSTSTGTLGAVIEYHAGGGAAWPEDFFCADRNMAPIAGAGAYEAFGHTDATSYNAAGISPDRTLGVAMHPNSPLLHGILFGLGVTSSTDPAERNRIKGLTDQIDGFIVAAASGSDSSDNKYSAAYLYARAGRLGNISTMLGTDAQSRSGGRHDVALGSAVTDFAPTIIGTTAQARQVGGRGALFNRLSADKARSVLETAAKMSKSKLDEFKKLSFEDQVKAALGCQLDKSVDLPQKFSPDSIYPTGALLTSDAITAAFDGRTFTIPGSASGPFVNNENFTALGNGDRVAAITRMVMQDHAGVGVISDGGYDNHNNTSRDPSRRRFQGGIVIGQMLRYADLVKKPLTIVALSDGAMGVTRNADGSPAVDASTGRIQRPGDSDSVALAFCLHYQPGASRGQIVRDANYRQIGSFTKLGVENYLKTARDTTVTAQVMVYNWLALQGKTDKLSKIVTLNPFLGADEEKYRVFNKV